MFKHGLAGLLLAFLVLLGAPAAKAADLSAAFRNLVAPGAATSISGPGRFQSAARNTFVAGGMEMRFPRMANVSLISITPPSYSAGCGGISAHFGGFSFISGEQIEQLIRSISQNATGFVMSMAIKTLCPMCESVIQAMNRLAQQASKMAMDSCAVGTNLATKMLDNFGVGPGTGDSRTQICASMSQQEGDASDWLSALDSVCRSTVESMGRIQDYIERAMGGGTAPDGEPVDTSVALLNNGLGNRTWTVLNALIKDKSATGVAQKVLLMNLVGTEIAGKGAYCTNAGGTPPSDEDTADPFVCPPTVQAKELMALFMCGLPERDEEEGNADFSDFTRSRALAGYCNSWFSPELDATGKPIAGGAWSRANATLQFWDCKDNYTKCMRMELEPLAQMRMLRGEGFAFQVNRLLREGARRVRANEAFNQGGQDEAGRQLLALVQSAPYPLYQAINAAAVYPAAAEDLLDTMSVLVAEMMAFQYFDEFIRLSGRSGGSTKVLGAHVDRILMAMGEIRGQAAERRRLIAQNIALQEALNEQIRSINLAIQRQVLTVDMLNANRFAITAGNPQSGGMAAGPGNP